MPIPIAVPIRPQVASEGIRLIQKVAEQGGDYCELWCDQLKLNDAVQIVKASDLPLIINLKDESEQGTFDGSPAERVRYLRDLCVHEQVAYVDIKHDLLTPELSEQIIKPIIASYHDFSGTKPLPDLLDIVDKLSEVNPAVIKIATTINHEIDVINLFQLQIRTAAWRKRRIIIGMGEKGIATRVMAPLFEHAMTFASLDSKTSTAPGQLSIKQLRDEWETLRFD